MLKSIIRKITFSIVLSHLIISSYPAEQIAPDLSSAPTHLSRAIRKTTQRLTSQQKNVWNSVKATETSFSSFILNVMGKGKYISPYLTIREKQFFSTLRFKRSQLVWVSKRTFQDLVKHSKIQLSSMAIQPDAYIYKHKSFTFYLDTGFDLNNYCTTHWDLISQLLIPTICEKNGYTNIKYIISDTLGNFLNFYLIWEVFRYLDTLFPVNVGSKIQTINAQDIDPIIWELVSFVGSTMNLSERFSTAKINNIYLTSRPIQSADEPKQDKQTNVTPKYNSHDHRPNPLFVVEKEMNLQTEGIQEHNFRLGAQRTSFGNLVCQDTYCRLDFCKDSHVSSSETGDIAFLGCGLVDPAMMATTLKPTLLNNSSRMIYLNDLCIEHILFSIYILNKEMNPSESDHPTPKLCSHFKIAHGNVLDLQLQSCSFMAIYAGFLVKYLAETGRFKDFQGLVTNALCLNGSLFVDEIRLESLKNFFSHLAESEVDQIYRTIRNGYEGMQFSEYSPINYYGYKVTKIMARPDIIKSS